MIGAPLSFAWRVPMTALLHGRLLNALRSVAGAPGGLQLGAFPTAMRQLVEMGLVEERDARKERHPSDRAWFLTPEGRALVS